ncbi:MAG TPA: hypothetical protein VGM69_22815 [Chloroflexota bacterium]
MLARVVSVALLLLALFAPAASAAEVDRSVAGGRWYSQTARPGELGFALIDDEQARFWSEFQRLGGVAALGFPVSRRFRMDGFVIQATQRVLMQWRPESGSVAFVNVFDRLHDLGQDDWLNTTRQTPRPGGFDDEGRAWDAVVRTRLAALDERPALRSAYFGVVGDALQANGLPTSRATDMGNHYALRAQRVVFQEWKEDVPWAKAGQVTVALGGDIAKERGLVPSAAVAPLPAVADGRIVDEAAATAPTPSAGPGVGLGGSAGPIRTDPAELSLRGAEVGPGARPIDDAPLAPGTLAEGRPDPAGYAARLEQLGYAAGHRRGFVRDAPDDPAPTRRYVVASEISLFRGPEAALAFWQLDAGSDWAAREPGIRLDRLTAPGVGDEALAFRVVSGDVAARGYMLLFRRANAIAFVSVLSQVSVPTLDETAELARVVDARLVRAMQP